jgi:16S rRNA (guanine966-N2)-methyltransferase
VPEAGRVITGSAGGTRLEAPGSGTRPISDRVKQALFGMLESLAPDVWTRPVLDLFAGSGALGVEALSRGAPRAVLVERDDRAATVIGRNLARTELGAGARIVRRDVAAFLALGSSGQPEAPFGLVFADPPYERTADLALALERLGAPDAGWLGADALVVAKHFWKTPPPEHSGALGLIRQRRFGETALSVYRRAAETSAGGA